MTSKLKIRNSNAYAILIAVCAIAILFMGMYVVMDPFAKIFNNFTDNSKYEGYTTPEDCEKAHGHWNSDTLQCTQLEEKVSSLLDRIRYRWLIAPIIAVVGLIAWMFSQTLKKDYQQYG